MTAVKSALCNAPKFCAVSLAVSLGFSLTPAFANDCVEVLAALDQEMTQVGTLIGDQQTARGSASLIQARVLRESANILRQRDELGACEETVAEARDLVKLASRPTVFAAENLVGRDVVDIDGEEVGEVVNIMVDLDHGVVAYALIEFGGFLGLGEELIPVPFNKIRQQSEGEALLILVNPERLEGAPRFDDDANNQLSQRSWANRTYRYYGENPYWRNPDRIGQALAEESSSRAVVAVTGEANSDVDKPESNASIDGSQAEVVLKDEKSAATSEDKSSEEQQKVNSFDDLFASLDSDSDGAIDDQEARREFVVMKRFVRLDQNDDGSLSHKEFSTLSETNQLSNNGEGLIPHAKDAMPEEKWAGGKLETEANSSD